MRKNHTGILLFSILFLLVTAHHHAAAQTGADLNTEKFAQEEKNTFMHLAPASRDGIAPSRVSMASTDFDINFYRCEWEIDPAVRFIKGKVTSYFTITSSTDKIIFDLSDTLTVDSIMYHGLPLTFQRIGGDGLQLQFPTVLSVGQKDSVSIYYNGVPRNYTSFRPFVQSTHNGNPVLWTLSEPFGAKEWWPCKNGLNDKTDSIDVLITNPASYQASSNGILTQETINNGSKLSVWKHRYPIATYLIAMAVSNYIVVKDSILVGGNSMPLADYAYPENTADFAGQLPFTKYILTLYNGLFGDYPFAKEKYGFTQFGANGGMEHQTNSFVNYPSNALVAHESAHQWFGDKITCGSWHDIWLNEGFATYCEVLVFENTNKNYFYLTLTALISSITSQPNGSVWVNDTTNASRIFDTRLTYYKGCYLLHMLRWKLGDDVFFSGLRRYLNDPLLKYNYAKTGDLQRNLEQESGQNLSSFFQNWFNNQGYPVYDLKWTQDSTNNLYITINQSTSDSSVSFFDMPVSIQFKNTTRDTIIVFNHTHSGQTFLANPGFRADTAIFDPYNWILCHSAVTHTGCGISSNDKTFPFYDIQWSQNANNWIFADIAQTNSAATAQADSIPLYFHFSGNGRDTILIIKNMGSHYSGWINAGFKVSNVFVSTSCLMSLNYTIASQTSNPVKNDIQIFPVPVINNLLNISLKNPSDKHLSVVLFNAAGQLMYQTKFDTPGKDELFTVPINNSAKGVYIIKLQSESAIRMSRKIIK